MSRPSVASAEDGGRDSWIASWFGVSRPSVSHVLRSIDQETRSDQRCWRCGRSTGQGEQTVSGCGRCRDRRQIVDRIIPVGSYHGQLVAAIQSLKYRRDWAMARPLGQLLASRIRRQIPRLGVQARSRWVIIPLPMPVWRRRGRGIDHARCLAAAVARQLDLPLYQPLRKRPGRPQASLTRSQRLRARVSDYRLAGSDISGLRKHRTNLGGRSIILIDDVLTTGRTVDAAGTLLRRLGPASIVAAVLAVSDLSNSPLEPPAALTGP